MAPDVTACTTHTHEVYGHFRSEAEVESMLAKEAT